MEDTICASTTTVDDNNDGPPPLVEIEEELPYLHHKERVEITMHGYYDVVCGKCMFPVVVDGNRILFSVCTTCPHNVIIPKEVSDKSIQSCFGSYILPHSVGDEGAQGGDEEETESETEGTVMINTHKLTGPLHKTQTLRLCSNVADLKIALPFVHAESVSGGGEAKTVVSLLDAFANWLLISPPGEGNEANIIHLLREKGIIACSSVLLHISRPDPTRGLNPLCTMVIGKRLRPDRSGRIQLHQFPTRMGVQLTHAPCVRITRIVVLAPPRTSNSTSQHRPILDTSVNILAILEPSSRTCRLPPALHSSLCTSLKSSRQEVAWQTTSIWDNNVVDASVGVGKQFLELVSDPDRSPVVVLWSGDSPIYIDSRGYINRNPGAEVEHNLPGFPAFKSTHDFLNLNFVPCAGAGQPASIGNCAMVGRYTYLDYDQQSMHIWDETQ